MPIEGGNTDWSNSCTKGTNNTLRGIHPQQIYGLLLFWFACFTHMIKQCRKLESIRKYLLLRYVLGVNCLGPTLGRWWNTELNFDICSLDLPNIVMYVAQLYLTLWTLGVWGWTRMNIFHSEHMPSNYYYWHFVKQRQELEI